MKRGPKFFLLIGFACLAIGLIGAAVSFKSVDLNEGIANIDIEKKISAANIDTLILQNDISGITFVPSNSDEIKVHLVGTVGEKAAKDCVIDAATEGNNVWRVNVATHKKNQINIGISLSELKSLIASHGKQLKTEISLPDKMFKAITISSDTGAINLKEIKAASLEASTDTGNISIDRYEGKQLNLRTDTGNITVDNGQGNVALRTDTGSITAKLNDIGDSVSLQSDVGSIRLKLDPAPKNASFDLRSDIGNVNLTIPGVNMERNENSGRHSAKGSIGDGSKQVKVQTDTGSISVTNN
ncbi:DUF4097 domain-containing protein [Paenibacillus sp. HWE-109]|uniref:DUF4097 family beta strand repeat-containing protein n=1 Tax=Paenibacillus sp. HWE-109 TaxID=1306526 RepID=UPI001EDF7565|nr:DUF4097 family beta strand repeat-containing protein [Paenibacillus sp. HWE-109]UKS26163.1 DUF4097 domain-containing protein [Paenibacillus sp. HWE-109]